jgi:hypothetical protein
LLEIEVLVDRGDRGPLLEHAPALPSAAMPVCVLLLKPTEPTVFDEMPSKPFHCTVIAHYPVTGSYAHVLVVSLSPDDERANQEAFGASPVPFLLLYGTRYEAEVLPFAAEDAHLPRLAVSVADIGSG